jgi:hypothetical protein
MGAQGSIKGGGEGAASEMRHKRCKPKTHNLQSGDCCFFWCSNNNPSYLVKQ